MEKEISPKIKRLMIHLCKTTRNFAKLWKLTNDHL